MSTDEDAIDTPASEGVPNKLSWDGLLSACPISVQVTKSTRARVSSYAITRCPNTQTCAVIDRMPWKVLERRCRDEVIRPDAEEGGVGVPSGKDGVYERVSRGA